MEAGLEKQKAAGDEGGRAAGGRRWGMVAAAVFVVVSLAATVIGAAMARAGSAMVYTDGSKIRVKRDGAPERRVLWEPAEAIRKSGAGAGGSVVGADEYEPRVSADGTMMILVRGKPGAGDGGADLMMSRLTARGWSEPVAIEEINTTADELGPELSRDGERLYFYSDRSGGFGGYDLWVSRREAGGEADEARGGWARWGEPINLGPGVNTGQNEYGPALTPDGERLFFASNRPREGEAAAASESWSATIREERSRHDYDLYEAIVGRSPGAREGAAQATRIALLNTSADEGAPAVSPGGDFLYFASDRTGGFGGFDVYRARLTKRGFGVIEHLDAAINSASDDMDPTLSSDGFRLYFSTNREPAIEAGERDTTAGAAAGEARGIAEPRPYRLWGSVSREVYLDRNEDGPGLAGVLGEMWPWLLLLLLLALLLYLLSRLMLSGAWRQRFRRLSLLAQCVLLSLALHMLIAGLLALWRVGNEISEYLAQAGGTRVILASAGPAGDAAAQVRGAFVSEESSVSDTTESVVERATVRAGEATIERLQTSVPSEDVPEASRAMELEAASARVPASEAEVEVGTVTPRGGSVMTEAGLPTAAAPEAATLEADASNRVVRVDGADAGAAMRPSVDVPGAREVRTSSPGAVSVEAETAVAPASVARASPGEEPIGEPRMVMPARAAGVREVGLPITPGVSSAEVGEATVEVRVESALEGGANEMVRPPVVIASDSGTVDGAAGSSALRIETAAPTVVEGAGEVRREAEGVAAVAARSRARQETAASLDAPSFSGPPRVTTGSVAAIVALPSSRATGDETRREAQAEDERGAPAVLPVVGRAAVRVGASDVAEPARIESSVPTARAAEASERATAVRIEPRDRRAAGDGGAGASVGSEVAEATEPRLGGRVAGGAIASGTRLPMEESPPEPTERFEQRDPEVRTEVLREMGGSKETERAVGLALEWFVKHQSADGRWSGRAFDEGCGACGEPAEVDTDGAMTGIVLLCFLGAGHTHQEAGVYQVNVSRAIEWLLARQEASGDLRRGETMYSQTIGTVALCEAYAMTRDERLAPAAKRAVEFLESNWRERGGASADNTSVLGWQVMAMESARRAGIEVSGATFEAASKWLDYVADARRPGRYAYRKGEPASAAMTAEAMFVRQLLPGAAAAKSLDESAEFILQTPPKWGSAGGRRSPANGRVSDEVPTYYWYYATLALFQHQGEAWKTWNESLVPALVGNQHQTGAKAGSWDPQDPWSRLGGRVYQTAICTLSLEVYYRYKPAGVQRATGR